MDDNRLRNFELDTILIKVASRCNINCTYCYVFNMGDDNWLHQEKLISNETIEAICLSLYGLIQVQRKCFSVVLHGGEPLLLGISKLKHLLQKLRGVLPEEYPISIQTNGILISKEILNVCSIYKVTVAVSIDGPKQVHDSFRITHKGTGTYELVLRGISELKSHPNSDFLFTGLLSVIDPFSDPHEIYSFFKELAPPSVDFLYRDGNHTTLPFGKASFHSIEYGTWMSGLLDVYLQDNEPLPIRVLDDMLKVILGGIVSKEGIGITDFGILVIDTDGTLMKNDTLKSSYNGADKFDNPININNYNLTDFLASTQFQEYKVMQRPTSDKCLNCPALNICGGGMMLHRWKKDNGFNNPSIYCSDQLHLIKNMRKAIAKLYFNA